MDRASIVRTTHSRISELSIGNESYRAFVLQWLGSLLAADVGKGDVTSRLLFRKDLFSSAVIISRNSGIAAGIEELKEFLRVVFPEIEIGKCISDGKHFHEGETLVGFRGGTIQILELERTMLNFLQRMCGIATFASRFVQKVPTSVLVCPTRKVLWGLLDKKACSVGGGGTHRLRLDDAILMKDNHLQVFGFQPEKILEKFSQLSPAPRFIEIEIDDKEQILPFAKAAHNMQMRVPIFFMFDNFTPRQITAALSQLDRAGLRDELFFEASGGITLENISEYAKTGVDILSAGALTHSAPALDLSLEMGAAA